MASNESRIRRRLKIKMNPNAGNKSNIMDDTMFNNLKQMLSSDSDFLLAVDIIKRTRFSESQTEYILKTKPERIWSAWLVSDGFPEPKIKYNESRKSRRNTKRR